MDLTAAVPDRDAMFVIDVDRFQGPLDLLLHLIKQQDIDIFDIPIARITEQFLTAIQGIEAEDLENAGEFVEMAAALVHIKVQMLLPRPLEDEDEDPRAELVRRLLEYELIREISARLGVSEAIRGRQSAKGYHEVRPPSPVADTPLLTTWGDVMAAAMEVRPPDPRSLEHLIAIRPVALEEKLDLILDTLRRESRVRFSRLVQPWRERIHGVMTLLAGLELSRRREVALRQSRPFDELWIYRNDADEPVPHDVDLG